MTRLDELVATITLGTETEAAAEAAFQQSFANLAEPPTTAILAGEPVSLLGVDALKRSGRFRARVRTAAGVELHVALDSLDISEPRGASLIAAYRHWLGYPDVVLDDHNADVVVSNRRIEDRVEVLRDAMAAIAKEFSLLDLDEIEPWLGDDDPWGRNHKYWPDEAHRYLELVEELSSLQSDIDEVASTGERKLAAELTLELLKTLEKGSFESWQHDDVLMVAEHALRRWLSVDGALGLALYEPERAVTLFFDKVVQFDLMFSLRRLVGGVAPQAHDALVTELISRLMESGSGRSLGDDRWTQALLAIRLEHDEIDDLLDDLPISYWSDSDMNEILESLAKRKLPQRSLQLTEQWLRAYEEREGNPAPNSSHVRKHHRALLAELGRGDESVAILLESLKEQPNATLFLELEKLAADDQPEVLEEALSLVATDVGVLLHVASKSASAAVAKQVAARSVDELRHVSSLVLAPAASALLSDYPEAAVRVYAALGFRHVDRGKADYYHLAHKAFETARKLYLSLNRKSEWDSVVQDVLGRHGRKYLFIPEFRRIAGLRKK